MTVVVINERIVCGKLAGCTSDNLYSPNRIRATVKSSHRSHPPASEYAPSSVEPFESNRSELHIRIRMPATKGRAMATSTAGRERTVTVKVDDPFSSLFQPSFEPGPAKMRNQPTFAGSEINPSHKAQTFMPPSVQPTFSDPLLQPTSTLSDAYVPKAEYVKARRSARDAWFAVMILGGFIALGTYWLVDRIGSDGAKINDLTSEVNNL